MIFATIGFSPEYEFPRLVEEMDRVAGQIQEEVVMQIGSNTYEPKNARFFRFASRDEMEKLYKDARVVVCHGGVGAIVSALRLSKPIIVVPRMKKYDEQIDDHQMELVQELSKEVNMRVVYDVAELEDLLKSACLEPARVTRNLSLTAALKGYINGLEETRVKRGKNQRNPVGRGGSQT